MRLRMRNLTLLSLVWAGCLALPLWAADQEPAAPPAEAALPAAEGEKNLSTSQDALALRYKRFEKTLLEMVEYMRKTDPDRAALLVRAIGKSKEDRIGLQMDKLVEILKEDRLGDAIERQGDLVVDLQALLDLLMSEDRQKEIEAEKKRIEAHLKELKKIIAAETDLRAANERGVPAEDLIPRQQKVADKTKEIGEKIDKEDQAKRAKSGDSDPESKPGSGEPKEGDSGEQKPGEQKPGEQKPGEGKPSEGKPSEGKPSEGQPSEGQPSEGQPSEGQPSDSQPSPSDKTPGREQIEQARREMQKAIENLEKKARDKASDNQTAALNKLKEAVEKLEEILRQLREEERDRLLTALEARFQKMLALQLAVYNDTVQIDKVPAAERTGRHTNKAVQISRQEEEIALEAARTLTLLRDEGTAVAFPEAVEQMRDDMRLVASRLERVEVGELTQSIELDIIEALKEMIEALQKEMEKKKDKDQPPGQSPPPGQPQDPALVELLAEIKMLRSLQLRVNGRTQRLGRLVDGEQATDLDVVGQLHKLSERQARIQRATYDLATGRNK